MTIYDDMQGIAGGLIGDFKQGVTRYIVVTAGIGPVDEPGPETNAAPVTFNGVVKGVSTKYVLNGLAEATDLQCTCAGNALGAINPKNGDKIEVDGVPIRIVQIVKKPAAGTVVAYTFIIRK